MDFKISEKDFEVIMGALAELPAKTSFNTIVSLQQQVNEIAQKAAQDSEKREPKLKQG